MFSVWSRKDPLCQESHRGKGEKQVKVGEAASRVGEQVYHTGQGQDERAQARGCMDGDGLDSAWSEASNPHRESGTRCRAVADVGAIPKSITPKASVAISAQRTPFPKKA